MSTIKDAIPNLIVRELYSLRIMMMTIDYQVLLQFYWPLSSVESG